jgi:hypothetical protein
LRKSKKIVLTFFRETHVNNHYWVKGCKVKNNAERVSVRAPSNPYGDFSRLVDTGCSSRVLSPSLQTYLFGSGGNGDSRGFGSGFRSAGAAAGGFSFDFDFSGIGATKPQEKSERVEEKPEQKEEDVLLLSKEELEVFARLPLKSFVEKYTVQLKKHSTKTLDHLPVDLSAHRIARTSVAQDTLKRMNNDMALSHEKSSHALEHYLEFLTPEEFHTLEAELATHSQNSEQRSHKYAEILQKALTGLKTLVKELSERQHKDQELVAKGIAEVRLPFSDFFFSQNFN